MDTSYVYFCGWQTHKYYNIGGFLLEAKANWGHTCIAGGLFLLRYNEYTFFETPSILNVPAALLDFKFSILKAKGYRINDLQIAKSHFLKEDLGAYGGNNSHDF